MTVRKLLMMGSLVLACTSAKAEKSTIIVNSTESFTWETSGQCSAKCDGDKTPSKPKEVVVTEEMTEI